MRRLGEHWSDELYLGMICKHEGNLAEALAHWEEMCRLHGDRWQVWISRASELAKLCRYDEAIADYERAMELMPHPQFVDAAEAIAQIHEIRGSFSCAIEYYEKVIELMRADWDETQGEAVDAPRRAIARLRAKMAGQET